ncbi:tetratricopeptide (TPR) repeat protein [Desulfitispora alkaliphila]|uniref:hypothetical protein n=1 Tax=Desulfitispora alkaliphila TaxID=622674 RepID=UPI003D23BF04
MNWLLIAIVILLVEILILALFWDKITDNFASYSHLYEKGVKQSEQGDTQRAIDTFIKMLAHPKLEAAEQDNPLKLAAYGELSRLYEQLVEDSEEGELSKLGESELKRALQFKIKELKAQGKWEQVKDTDLDLVRLRLKLAAVYTANKTNLEEAQETFFYFNKWKSFREAYGYYSKTSEFFKLGRIERELLEDRVKLVDAILQFKDASNEGEAEEALNVVGELLAIRPAFLGINDSTFNEMKSRLGHHVVEELAASSEEGIEGENRDEQSGEDEEVKSDTKEQKLKGVAVGPLAGDNWKRIAAKIHKVSRVIIDVQHTGAEVHVKVQTEWYLLPLIFKEELVEKVVQVYYAMTMKKDGSVLFVFRDDKGREVARHTILGTKIYN